MTQSGKRKRTLREQKRQKLQSNESKPRKSNLYLTNEGRERSNRPKLFRILYKILSNTVWHTV
jgi:hypothetical protein